MKRMILMELKEREMSICKRCGKAQSVKYRVGDNTYCNRCAPIVAFDSRDVYDDEFDMNLTNNEEDR